MAQHPFDPGDPELPLIEQARTALADNRKVATEALGELFEETDNPMLGLFGAHLMLIARDAALQEDEERESGRLREAAVTARWDSTRHASTGSSTGCRRCSVQDTPTSWRSPPSARIRTWSHSSRSARLPCSGAAGCC